MATTVGSHGVAAFSNPSNGDALDATIVKGNDNTLRSAYVTHDSDSGIHVQSSALASRPAAGTEGRKWITTDTGSVKLWYDNGAAWEEIDYVPNSGTATVDTLAVTNGATFDGDTLVVDHTNDRVGVNTSSPTVALDVTGAAKVSAGLTITTTGLTVSGGGAAITGNSTITGTLGGITGLTVASGGANISGTVTATEFSGSGASLTNIPAANLTGTAAAINGSNITALNASNLASGTVPMARIPTSLTGLSSVQSAVLAGAASNTSVITLANSFSEMLEVPSGSGFRIQNNGNPNGWSITGPLSLSSYNSGQDDLFLKVKSNGVDYYIRLERWT